jgi:hypothetical protein
LKEKKKTGGEKNDLGPGQQADGASPFAPLKKKRTSRETEKKEKNLGLGHQVSKLV